MPRALSATRLTSRGRVFAGIAAVLFIAAYSLGSRELLLVACLLTSLLLAAAIYVFTRTMTLQVTRTFSPSPVAAGMHATVGLQVTNVGQIRSAPAIVRDALPWNPWKSGPAELGVLRPRSINFGPSRQPSRLTYRLTPARRGIFQIGPLSASYSDPFSLVSSTLTVGERQPLLVTPRVETLPEAGLWIQAPDGAARLVHPTATSNDDDLMTREYRRGDALRRVHWRASARHGQLMVRQEEQRSFPEARIVIDTTRSGYATSNDPGSAARFNWLYPESESFEWAVRMVASLGSHLHDLGFLVHVMETGEPQITDPGVGSGRADRGTEFLESLAGVRLASAHSHAARGRARSGKKRGEVALGPAFAIVSRPDDETLDWLITLRRPFEQGLAFVVDGTSATVSALRAAGWHAQAVSATTDLDWAWTTLAESPGLARVAD